MGMDFDLTSIQEARDIIRKAKSAQLTFARYTEPEIERILKAMVKAVEDNVEWLSKLAVDETKYGVYEHKIIKNLFASRDVYNYIKDLKTIGILSEDPQTKVVEVGVPIGLILGIIPTTNPSSTLIHNSLCALKSGNAIVFSPHPNAIKCTTETARLLHDAAVNAGAPDGLIGCISKVTIKAVEEMMHNEEISTIVATGGSVMVKAAYSSGKPALGVGPGNVPAFVERSANIKKAARDIVNSKTFDNGMICASEQAILADEPIKEELVNELKDLGCHFLNDEETERVSRVVMHPNGSMNSNLVGQDPKIIADKADINIPAGTRLLIASLKGLGPGYPLSYEKLTTVLAFYTVKNWHEGCLMSIELLKLGGVGHSVAIHSQNEGIIREFIHKPVFRILVNTPSALGGIGYSTGLKPSMTLGSGSIGGSSLSDNLDPRHLVNIKRLAYGIKDYEPPVQTHQETKAINTGLSSEAVTAIVRQVLEKIQKS